MKDILEKEICQQIRTLENEDFSTNEQPSDYEREKGSLTNDNIVFSCVGICYIEEEMGGKTAWLPCLVVI